MIVISQPPLITAHTQVGVGGRLSVRRGERQHIFCFPYPIFSKDYAFIPAAPLRWLSKISEYKGMIDSIFKKNCFVISFIFFRLNSFEFIKFIFSSFFKGYLVGTTNLLFFQSPLTKADVKFDVFY